MLRVIRPNIYQSIREEGIFGEIENVIEDYGFECWTEEHKYILLSEKNEIIPNPQIVVQKETAWKDEYGIEIFACFERTQKFRVTVKAG